MMFYKIKIDCCKEELAAIIKCTDYSENLVIIRTNNCAEGIIIDNMSRSSFNSSIVEEVKIVPKNFLERTISLIKLLEA
jgi:hypothetical protein